MENGKWKMEKWNMGKSVFSPFFDSKIISPNLTSFCIGTFMCFVFSFGWFPYVSEDPINLFVSPPDPTLQSVMRMGFHHKDSLTDSA
jgi:hypothetical protein